MTTGHGVQLYTGTETVAALVAHAVNSLDVESPCCPHECAPCTALLTLHTRGALSAVIAPYIESSGADWDWWSDDNTFDWQWVLDRWCDLATCDNREDSDG